jgi:molybdopterin/thiamine biosynthesis adenylyltransferase
MATIRIAHEHWKRTHDHLYSKSGEHFAFFLAKWAPVHNGPVFLVQEVLLIDDREVEVKRGGWVLANAAVTRVINAAVRSGCALIEAHNHGGVLPRFSGTDRAGFREFVPYALDSLRDRPYGATVWGDDTVYAEFFSPGGGTGIIDSIVVYGTRLDQIVSRDDDQRGVAQRFDRQAPWFTPSGQRKLGRLRIGVVGAGGTGGPLIQNLVYLGARDFVVIDHDSSDETSMNRLVTATAADVGTPKAMLARRLVKAVAPDARVEVVASIVQSSRALDALRAVDVIFGCVDNDGARVVLNDLALAYNIPYFDLAVGIDAERGRVESAGGRLAIVLPGGPCLYCMNQIDADEARFWLATPEQQAFMRRQGYVKGMDVPAPSVVALNGGLAAAAATEFAIYATGLRAISPYLELDILGTGRAVKAQWMTPVGAKRKPGCPACELAGLAGAASVEKRYTAVS